MAQTLTHRLNRMSSEELTKEVKRLEEKARRRGRVLENPPGRYKRVYTKGSDTWREATDLFHSVRENRLTGKQLENATDDMKKLRIKQLESYLKMEESSVEGLRKRHRREEAEAGKKLTEQEVYEIIKAYEQTPEKEIPSDYIHEAAQILAGSGATHQQIIALASKLYKEREERMAEYEEESRNFTPLY